MIAPRLSIGTTDFAELREPGVLFVDKSGFIGRVIDDPYKVMLLPRPRRFGKTTNLSMLGYFLGKGPEERGALFQDLLIWQSAEARAHFQRYPLISLTFKDIKEKTWAACRALFSELLTQLYQSHSYLLGGLPPADASAFGAILNRTAPPELQRDALRMLSQHLHRHHGQKVLVIVDEYDTPLHEAFLHGYYDEALGFFRGFLSGGLKDNVHLWKGVLTGILRIAKESLFSDLNNIGVYSLLSPRFAGDFGFTEAEVDDLRGRLRSQVPMEELRRWYNGYNFGGEVIYNPWSVMSALGRPQEPLRAYWAKTASDELLHELLFRFGGGEEGQLTELLGGGAVRKQLREDLALREVFQGADALWNFLLFVGYLKCEDVRVEEGETWGRLRLPNLEVTTIYAGFFGRWLEKAVGGERQRDLLIAAILQGDAERMQEFLQRLLVESVSFHDVGGARSQTPPEHVYQMFILGLLVSMPRHRVVANREGGHGRYDVMLLPREAGLPGAVLELKVKRKGGTLAQALAAAKQQLLAKDYAAELRAQGASPVHQVAVAFDGKRVLVGLAEAQRRKGAASRAR